MGAAGARAGQGAGVAELLAAFDAVHKKHEAMHADEFNNDGTYQRGINTVLRAYVFLDDAAACDIQGGHCPSGTCEGTRGINTVHACFKLRGPGQTRMRMGRRRSW